MPRKPNDDQAGLTEIDRYNHSDNNWWCAWDLQRHATVFDELLVSTFGLQRLRLQPALLASFVFRNTDHSELKRLSKIACAPKMLTARTIEWVNHPRIF